MTTEPEHNPWVRLSRERRYDNRWIEVTHHEVTDPSGQPGIYGVVHFKNLAVGVVPVDAEGCTWLVGQWRYTMGSYSWEIPEGGGPLGVALGLVDHATTSHAARYECALEAVTLCGGARRAFASGGGHLGHASRARPHR